MNAVPRLSRAVRRTALVCCLAAVPDRARSAPVISEIMFEPPGAVENTAEEWIELTNVGTEEYNVSGCRFTKGVTFTIPEIPALPGNQTLVAAADPAAFLAAHPGFTGRLTGGWTGKLSNGGEDVRLEDPAGGKVDEITYSSEGDWALRARPPVDRYGHQGWRWESPAAGGGYTLQRINLTLPGDFGQNWLVSPAPGGEPGQYVLLSTGAEILISGADHSPVIPRSGDPIVFRVRVHDRQDGTVPPQHRLFWRRDGQAAFQSVDASREGIARRVGDSTDEQWVVTLPPQPNGTIIEYYWRAEGDGAETAIWPAPARVSAPGVVPEVFAQAANALLQVDDSFVPGPWTPGARSDYRIIMTAAERAELTRIQTTAGQEDSDAAMNGTFISVDGGGTELRYLTDVRNRGFGSRLGPPNNFYIGLRKDQPWKGRTGLQINCRFPHSQVLGANVFAMAGIAEQSARPVRLRVNGQSLAETGTRMFGSYARVEPMNGEWVERHYPEDPDGNLYQLDDHEPNPVGNPPGDLGRGEFRYEGTNPLAYSDVYFKKTNEALNDWTDLMRLTRVLSAPVTGGTEEQPAIPDSEYRQRVAAVLDYDQWLTFLALDALIGNQEGGLQSGRGDDCGLYCGVADQRFRLVPHDFDAVFGLGLSEAAGNPVTRGIFSYDTLDNGVQGLRRFFNHPEITGDYYARLLRLMDTVFTREKLDPLIDELMTGWVNAPTIAGVKTFIDNRRANVLSQIPREYAFTTQLAAGAAGFPESADGAASFRGTFHAGDTRSILVNGQAATLYFRTSGPNAAGSWTFTAPAGSGFLRRGVNRVSAVFYSGVNGTGSELRRMTMDVYYPGAGGMTEVSGTLTASQPPASLALTVPDAYLPGVPVLVRVEARDAAGKPDRTRWNDTAVLSAGNGIVLSPPTVRLFNGVGSALVTPSATSGSVSREIFVYGASAVSGGSSWRHLTTGADPGAGWRDAGFDDSAWPEGPTQIGYGDGDEHTAVPRVDYNPAVSGTQSAPTYYFRNTFTVADAAAAGSFAGEVKYDDGAVVYVNGTQVLRTSNVPAGATHETYATGNSLENATAAFSIPPELIRAGVNVIAVEVKQLDPPSSDMSFDLRLVETAPVTDPGNFTLSAAVAGSSAAKPIASLAGVAPVIVSGALPAGPTTWSGVVRVTGDVTVPAGAVLTLAEGTLVLMDGTAAAGSTTGTDIIVRGALVSQGTAEQPVSITCSDASARWGQIAFENAQPSSLTWTLVTRGGHAPGQGHTGKGPLIRLAASALTVTDSALGDSPAKALYSSGTCDLVLRRSLLARTITGPELGDGCALLVENSNIQEVLPIYRESNDLAPDDEDCLYVHNGTSRPVLVKGSVFALCGDDVFDCLGGPITVEDCVLRDGWDKGMSLLDNDLQISRTLIVDCDKAIVPKSRSAATRVTDVKNCTIVCEDHNTALSPWGYAVPPSNPDPDSPSTGLYTQNKAGQSNTSAVIRTTAVNTIIIAKAPVLVDAPYPASGTTVTHSTLFDTDDAAAPVWPGAGNIGASPLFVDETGRRLFLSPGSPARDTGDPAAPNDPDGTRADMGALPYDGARVTPAGEVRWTAAASPYHLTGNVTIPAGVTLRIEPGVSVFVDQNRRLTVSGRLLAEGTANARIRFSGVPGVTAAGDADPLKNGVQTGSPKWGGVRVQDSLTEENVVAYVDFVDAQGISPSGAENFGSIGFLRSWGRVEHCTWAGTHLRMCYGRNSKLTVRHCVFPDMFLFDPLLNRIENTTDFVASADNNQEPLKVEYPSGDAEVSGKPQFTDGLPVNGWFRVYYNEFNGNRGHNDVFDADSGRWNVPGQFVLDCRYNHFRGISGDEHIDLGGDAYIASNIFERATKDQWTSDTGYSNAVSSGDRGTGTTLVLARNVFFALDHAVNLKASTGVLFEHNTVADFTPDFTYHGASFGTPFTQEVKCAPVNVFIPEDGSSPTYGDGGYLGFNIISGVPRLVSGADSRKVSGVVTHDVTTKLEIRDNLLHELGTTELGPNHPGGLAVAAYVTNVTADPLFSDPAAGDYRPSPGSPAIAGAPGGLPYGAAVPEWAYILGGPPPVTSSTTASFTVGGPGLVRWKWRLNGGVWSEPAVIGSGGVFPRSGATVRTAALALTGLTPGPQMLEVLGQDMAGNWQDADPAKEPDDQAGPTVRAWTVTPAPRVLLHEILAAASTDGEEFMEIRNPGPAAADLAGWEISTGEEPGSGHFLPEATVVPAGGYLLLRPADIGLSLSRAGDRLFLRDENGAAHDSIAFGPQAAGFSLSLIRGTWTLGSPTPGTDNQAAALGDPSAVRFNEWYRGGDIRFDEDWVELFNPSAFPVSLTGLRITDNPRTGAGGTVFPPLSFVGPGGYAAFEADKKPEDGPSHLDFSLDAEQDALVLYNGNARIDLLLMGPALADYSATRAGVQELPTRGFAMNPAAPAYLNALEILRHLRITEIMYDPTGGNDYEYIELTNTGAAPLAIGGVTFTRGITYTFPVMTLSPGARAVLVAKELPFRARYGPGPVIAGTFGGRLDNSGETLAFALPPPFDANVLSFSYSTSWFAETNGAGRSLELIDNSIAPGLFGVRSSWRASLAERGSPGDAIPAGAYLEWVTQNGLSGAIEEDPDRDGLGSLVEFALGTLPRVPDGEGALPLPVIRPDGRYGIDFRLPASELPGGLGAGGVTYFIEESDGLGEWRSVMSKSPDRTDWETTLVPAPSLEMGNPDAGTVPVSWTSAARTNAAVRKYLRLSFTLAQ